MDTNSHFISRKLHELGVQVKKISAIGDNVDEISDEIRAFSERFDYVFTTGGVGPTHDDKTYIGRTAIMLPFHHLHSSRSRLASFSGLAQAFNDSLHKSPEIVAAIEKYFPPGGLSSDRDLFVDKLSTIPSSAQLLWGARLSNGKPSSFPVVRLNNVISLPGVPRFCERAFMELKDQLFPSSEVKPLFSKTLYTTEDELKFAEKLTRIASNYEDVVEIGSYPIMKNRSAELP
ncbi:molybdopterin binding domain protein [Ancylostoma duodenale]|uniref:Molybdopterin binding domain protein n=1 Tax=Ancylostoma duodenale TaxID=51022 RepID=A0A0C2GMH0_9BILA|nr:molybdopterin binding domain protein [Ancylostoma duodenale]